MRDAPSNSGDVVSPSVGHSPRSAARTYDQSTTGSLSPSSRLNHATGLVASSASRQVPSSVVLPYPAGAATSVTFVPGPARSRSTRRSRASVCVRTGGGCSFVINERWLARQARAPPRCRPTVRSPIPACRSENP